MHSFVDVKCATVSLSICSTAVSQNRNTALAMVLGDGPLQQLWDTILLDWKLWFQVSRLAWNIWALSTLTWDCQSQKGIVAQLYRNSSLFLLFHPNGKRGRTGVSSERRETKPRWKSEGKRGYQNQEYGLKPRMKRGWARITRRQSLNWGLAG